MGQTNPLLTPHPTEAAGVPYDRWPSFCRLTSAFDEQSIATVLLSATVLPD
jgi:hypothetical protein